MTNLQRQLESRTMLNRISNLTNRPLTDPVGDRLRKTIKRELNAIVGGQLFDTLIVGQTDA